MRTVFIDGAEDMRVEDTPLPEPQEGQVRLKVDYVGVCGSDLHYYFDGANGAFVVREPLTPGHEMAGTIDFDPSGTWQPGTPVTIHPARFGAEDPTHPEHPHLWKGGSYLGSASTWPHTQGAMADHLIVDLNMVRALPDGLPTRLAALAEPLGVALHALNQAGGVTEQRVFVSGAGPIGLLVAGAALIEGATQVVVSEPAEGARRRALTLGVQAALDPTHDALPAGEFDVVFECSGAPQAISAAFEVVRGAGTVVQVGMVPNQPIGVNLAPFVSKEVTYRSSFRFKDEVDRAVEMLAENPVLGQVITHEFDVSEVVEAFQIARDAEGSGKVLVSFR